jgi:hypothetical protein
MSPSANPIQCLSTFAGLACSHADCDAIFSNLDNSISHADTSHAGSMLVKTCDVVEVTDGTGETKLVRVSEEFGECTLHSVSRSPMNNVP